MCFVPKPHNGKSGINWSVVSIPFTTQISVQHTDEGSFALGCALLLALWIITYSEFMRAVHSRQVYETYICCFDFFVLDRFIHESLAYNRLYESIYLVPLS
jgi:hypothetical protein